MKTASIYMCNIIAPSMEDGIKFLIYAHAIFISARGLQIKMILNNKQPLSLTLI